MVGINNLKVSVVMRTKNSDWIIDQSLASLFSQKFKNFELIIVDSGSTDSTLEIVGNYPCKLIEIEPHEYIPGKVLNDAINFCGGEIIVFQNSDVVQLHDCVLGDLVDSFNEDKVQAAYCRQIPRPDAKPWVCRDYAISFPLNEKSPQWMYYSLPMAAMRRSIWKQHKFYTDSWASEDTEWGFWAYKNNISIKYLPNACVMHSHNYSLKQIYGRRFVEGEADVFIFDKKNKILSVLKKYLSSCIRDVHWHFRCREISEMFYSPIRRFVYQLAYLKGVKHGRERIKNGNKNIIIGQKIVLNSHESNVLNT